MNPAKSLSNPWMIGVACVVMLSGAGCAVKLSQRSPWDVDRLERLSDELDEFRTLAELQASESDRLEQAKNLLEAQVDASAVNVGYDERGLVTRFIDQLLFDSGQALLREGAFAVLDQVASVLKSMPDQPVGIEGHTDNKPIKVSGWADNDELSKARANAVADYLTKEHQIDAQRLTVIGYGEYKPIAENDTVEGRRKNRRVEIVILPQSLEESYGAEADRVSEGETRFVK